MLMELLSKAATVAMLSFVVSSMLAMGAGLTVSQIAEPLAQRPAGDARSAGQFRRDATRRAGSRESALARRTVWGRTLAAWLCGRRAVPAEAR